MKKHYNTGNQYTPTNLNYSFGIWLARVNITDHMVKQVVSKTELHNAKFQMGFSPILYQWCLLFWTFSRLEHTVFKIFNGTKGFFTCTYFYNCAKGISGLLINYIIYNNRTVLSIHEQKLSTLLPEVLIHWLVGVWLCTS